MISWRITQLPAASLAGMVTAQEMLFAMSESVAQVPGSEPEI
jgi:hypothetical protein